VRESPSAVLPRVLADDGAAVGREGLVESGERGDESRVELLHVDSRGASLREVGDDAAGLVGLVVNVGAVLDARVRPAGRERAVRGHTRCGHDPSGRWVATYISAERACQSSSPRVRSGRRRRARTSISPRRRGTRCSRSRRRSRRRGRSRGRRSGARIRRRAARAPEGRRRPTPGPGPTQGPRESSRPRPQRARRGRQGCRTASRDGRGRPRASSPRGRSAGCRRSRRRPLGGRRR